MPFLDELPICSALLGSLHQEENYLRSFGIIALFFTSCHPWEYRINY